MLFVQITSGPGIIAVQSLPTADLRAEPMHDADLPIWHNWAGERPDQVPDDVPHELHGVLLSRPDQHRFRADWERHSLFVYAVGACL